MSKKILNTTSYEGELSIKLEGKWQIIKNSNCDLLQFLERTESEIIDEFTLSSYNEDEYQDALPFRPTAYRDFMLYEKHAIDAARGFVKKYMPNVLPLINIFEKLTGRPFPKLKPAKRYYKYPIYYLGNHLNFVSENHAINIPSYTEALDYELEIAAIITKPLLNASIDEVTDAIGGFVILNDFSARDVQLDELKSGFGPMKTKNFKSSISAIVVSKDEILSSIDNLKARVFINNERIAQSSTQNKRYSFQEAIAYASWEEQLHPGEIFGSGTIPGCTGIENGRMLEKGDKITLEVEKMGRLSNMIV